MQKSAGDSVQEKKKNGFTETMLCEAFFFIFYRNAVQIWTGRSVIGSVQAVLRFSPRDAIDGESVVLLERAHRIIGLFAVNSIHILDLAVAQILECLLEAANIVPLASPVEKPIDISAGHRHHGGAAGRNGRG